jgi:hypothetical protein
MDRTGVFLPLVLTFVVATAACGGDRAATEYPQAAGETASVDGRLITITGCLTGAPERDAFVLSADRTAMTSALPTAGDARTYTYQLVGVSADLAAHVGQQVEVRGRLERGAEDDVQTETSDTRELPETTAGGRTVSPAVETTESVDIRLRRLHVDTVTPTGAACQVGTATPR